MTNLLTTTQAAGRLGVTPRWVAKLCARGVLPSVRPGRAYLITEEALADYLRRKADGLLRGVGRPRKPETKGGDTNDKDHD